jgi:exodeoxyribonuclease VII small subunit
MNEEENIKNSSTSNKTEIELNFETAIAKLESHVRTLEQGELTLDESLTIFEEGMKLAKFCTKKLNEAEHRIEILMEKDGELMKKDFELPED